MEANLFRPKRALILAMAQILRDDEYLRIPMDKLVGETMRLGGGQFDPGFVRNEWAALLDEAGIRDGNP